MKQAPTTGRLAQRATTSLCKSRIESCVSTLPLFKEQEPRCAPNAITATATLQQQLGKPDSVRHVARRSHKNSDQTRIGDQERIAEHLSSAMALAESLQGRKAGNKRK